MRTEKWLKERDTVMTIKYKHITNKIFKKNGYDLENNMLTRRVQPDEGISFQFNSKVPGSKVLIESVNMDFCHECKFGPGSAEAYELLLYDVMQGDHTLFTRWDEVENSWKIIDEIRDAWHGIEPEFYKPGNWCPKKADKLQESSGRKWDIPIKPQYTYFLEK